MTRRATHIYHWTNGMIIAIDEYGVQMPELQSVGLVSAEQLTAHIKRWRAEGKLSMAVRVTRGAKWDERNE